MKKNVAFMSLAMMAIMAETNFGAIPTQEPRIPNLKREPNEAIPKGMKWFCFKQDGSFKEYEKDGAMLREEVYFRCYAINSKNAIKKFNKFKESNEK